MSDKFRAILDALPEKPPRSRLEPYSELIDELRRRRRTYREIVSILAEKRPSGFDQHHPRFRASEIKGSKEGGEASANLSAQCRHPQSRVYSASPECAPVEPG